MCERDKTTCHVLLEQHGYKEGETAYIEQKELPVEAG